MRIKLTAKADPNKMRDGTDRQRLIKALQKLGATRKPIPIDIVARTVRVRHGELLQFKKKVRVLRREGLLRTLRAA